MNQTVIGFFDDASEAQKAVEKLQGSGISRDRIDISRGNGNSNKGSVSHDRSGSAHGTGSASSGPDTERTTSDGRTVDKEGRNTNKVTDFFNNLFGGSDNDDADKYRKVAERSGAIVTVHAQSKDEAERASELMDDCGAFDVDERSAKENNREMETGSLRQRSRIVERPVEEHLRLRDDHGNMDRQQVNRPNSGQGTDSFREGEVRLNQNEGNRNSDLRGSESGRGEII